MSKSRMSRLLSMQITGSLPMHVLRAYGVSPTAAARPAQPAPAPAATRPADGALVAGKVSQAPDFSGNLPARAEGALPLYGRAADRIEAAIGLELGRNLDITG